MVTPRLFTLLDEFLVIIFSISPARSVSACSLYFHRLRVVIDRSELLKWRKWSTEHGIQELLPSGLSLPDLYKNVQKWENRWFHFNVENEVATSSMYRPSQGSPRHRSLCPTKNDFLLRSGYLIQMHEKEGPGWSHIRLPPPEPREFIQNPVWTEVRFGDRLAMEGWALDLDQDLVTASLLPTGVPVGRLEIHLICFTTGKRHESANIPAVLLEFQGKYDRSFGTHIEIMGNHVVVLLAHRTSLRKYQTLYLVDWIKGHVIYQQRFSADTYFPVLTSISEDTFVLGLRSDWALALCRITKAGDALTFRTLCKLKLPDIRFHTRVQLKSFDRAPSGPDNPSAPRRHSTPPFRNSPSESVLSFYVHAEHRWNLNLKRPVILFFYIHPSALRALAESTSLSPMTLPVTVPWENWGPKNTRWIKPESRSARQSLSGPRCAIFMEVPGDVHWQLLDFNPSRVRILESLVGKNGWGHLREKIVNSQSTISAGFYFKHKIVSHLPYFVNRGRGAEGQLLIDDQWVVQTRKRGNSFSRILGSAEPAVSGHTIRLHSVEGFGSKKSR